MSRDDEPDGLRQIKLGFVIGAVVGAYVVAWLLPTRPPDDALSSGGFNMPVTPVPASSTP